MARSPESFPDSLQRRSHRLRRIDTIASWALDAAIAAATLVPTIFVMTVERNEISAGTVAEIAIGAVLSVAPLVVRRRWPVGVLAFILLIGLLVPGPAVFSPPALLAVYTVASRRSRDLALGGAVATVLAFAAHRLLHGYPLPPIALVTMAALCGLAVAAGLYQRTRLAYLDELADRSRRLERERLLLADQAVSDERLRVARELHDVVANNVTLMVITAQALGGTSEEPETIAATDSIARLGRETMSEMHTTLSLMRPEDAAAELEPPPTLGDLRALVEQTRQRGLEVELLVEGAPRPLPTAIELSAYRIVQEALANVAKHAGDARASVRLAYEAKALALAIADDGRGAGDTTEFSGGHGLIGMRERVALFGGEFAAGPAGDRGFKVSATFPCEPAL